MIDRRVRLLRAALENHAPELASLVSDAELAAIVAESNEELGAGASERAVNLAALSRAAERAEKLRREKA